jgi:hypothetical protein
VPDATVMSKADEYRKNAADTVDLARRTVSMADKSRLLALAESWLDLADRAHRVATRHLRRAGDLHPLIRAKLSDDARE